jgi:hypothetical protein
MKNQANLWSTTPLACQSHVEDTFKLTSDKEFYAKTARAIFQHHRETGMPRKRIHLTMFLIANRDPPDEKGILMVNLKPYHGLTDALRQPPQLAGNDLASMSIANTDWCEHRAAIEPEQPEGGIVPEDRFAL